MTVTIRSGLGNKAAPVAAPNVMFRLSRGLAKKIESFRFEQETDSDFLNRLLERLIWSIQLGCAPPELTETEKRILVLASKDDQIWSFRLRVDGVHLSSGVNDFVNAAWKEFQEQDLGKVGGKKPAKQDCLNLLLERALRVPKPREIKSAKELHRAMLLSDLPKERDIWISDVYFHDNIRWRLPDNRFREFLLELMEEGLIETQRTRKTGPHDPIFTGGLSIRRSHVIRSIRIHRDAKKQPKTLTVSKLMEMLHYGNLFDKIPSGEFNVTYWRVLAATVDRVHSLAELPLDIQIIDSDELNWQAFCKEYKQAMTKLRTDGTPFCIKVEVERMVGSTSKPEDLFFRFTPIYSELNAKAG